MKIEKVTYQKTYSIGPYLTDRVGFEATPTAAKVNPDNTFELETTDVILSNLEKIADEWHRKAHPHLYQEEGVGKSITEIKGVAFFNQSGERTGAASFEPTKTVQVEFRNGQQDTLDGIQSATTLEELSTFKKLSGNNKELYEAYNQRLKELTQ